jgi:hypothetical protein
MALGAQLLSAGLSARGSARASRPTLTPSRRTATSLKPKHEAIMDGAFDKVTDPVDDSVTTIGRQRPTTRISQLQARADTKLDVAGNDGWR